MSSDAAHDADTFVRGDITTEMHGPSLQAAIPGLLDDIVVTHNLRSEYFGDEPADLARLRPVSRGMRDAVAATGVRVEELDEKEASCIGCLSAVQRLDRRGRVSRLEFLCEAAARGGQLEKLKVLRANGCPWDRWTCSGAAYGGHLEVLQWLCTNGCPWDNMTCLSAAMCGHLEVLQWARANGCTWTKRTLVKARARGYHELVNWAITNGCPEPE
tara:strand:+ start:37777 stop:38421 length:645 start_codon:yes stop_codon:yes gene_type:complete